MDIVIQTHESISHIALTVRDPARTAALFRDLFGARGIEREDDDGHRETFVRLGGIWIVLVGASVNRARTGDHIAFNATPEILEATVAKLEAMGREFIRARSNRALYFFDYDDHVFEMDTERLDKELGTQLADEFVRGTRSVT
ncbi:MAG: VOC family protein [Steroidobacteraceae bacterium]